MTRTLPLLTLLLLLGGGCTMMSRTDVDTGFNGDRVPHRVVAPAAEGSDGGFLLLGFLPLSSASQEGALADAFERAGLAPGNRLVVTEARFIASTLFCLLFSVQSVDVKARIVELTAPR
jgi:hypothetical protein